MFNELLESKPRRQRSVGGVIVSVTSHSVVIVATIFGTLHAREVTAKPKADVIVYAGATRNEPPPIEKAPPPNVTAVPPQRKGFSIPATVVEIPTGLPAIDFTTESTNANDFGGKGAPGGVANGREGGTGPVNDRPYSEFQVEKQVIQAPGSPAPRYPEILKSGMVEGEVLAQFVVDTTGRAQPGSFKVLKSTHELFTAAVRNALPQMRFLPAEIGGRKVKQLVQQPFAFAIAK